MSMTRKHFERIARDVREARVIAEKNQHYGETKALDYLVDALCESFLRFNYNFDRDRFIRACKTPETRARELADAMTNAMEAQERKVIREHELEVGHGE